jgi:23S rRNA pseudouridine1911/1915/1917 synthase
VTEATAPTVRAARPQPLRERLRTMHPTASGRSVKKWLETGRVRVNGDVVRRGDVFVGPTDRVELTASPPPPFPSALRLVHEDDDVLVVVKPTGLLTIATERERERTAYRMLAEYARARASRPHLRPLFVVHRLDRDTSGLLVFARTPLAKVKLQEQFKARSPERLYVAVVEGRVRDDSGALRARLGADRSLRVRPRGGRAGRDAVTQYRVLERRRDTTVLELRLATGRRGQIRAHLAALGHPIVGDRAYGARRNSIGRLCLHAIRLGFVHPRGQRMQFESPVPPAFARA